MVVEHVRTSLLCRWPGGASNAPDAHGRSSAIGCGPVRTRRRHLDAARRDARREVPLPDRSSIQLAHQLLADISTPSRLVSKRELARLVRRAVAQLPDAEREIVLMRVFEGLSNVETAHVLGIDPATGSRRYARALLRLHDKLRRAGVEEGP